MADLLDYIISNLPLIVGIFIVFVVAGFTLKPAMFVFTPHRSGRKIDGGTPHAKDESHFDDLFDPSNPENVLPLLGIDVGGVWSGTDSIV
jgi:hypothetical protein